MHMADALVSPVVGGALWAASAGLIAYGSKKIRQEGDDGRVPLMGVLGAFIFASQMINFTIPGTGSSGHLGGGMILAILLGPWAAFLTLASVLTVQALFFADGGLLALGCNMFNLGFFPCFVAYPLIYQRIVGSSPTRGRVMAGAMASAVVGLQLGALAVVAETLFSGVSDLPFASFALLMQPIHLAIGVVEGLATAAVVLFVARARPEILEARGAATPGSMGFRKMLLMLLAAAVVIGGGLSWFASTHPDGLEWSLFHATGKEEMESPGGVHDSLARVQEKTAILPDYGFREGAAGEAGESRPAVSTQTSVSGLVGGALTLALAGIIGLLVRRKKKGEG